MPIWLALALVVLVFERAIDVQGLWRQMPGWSWSRLWAFWSVGLGVWVVLMGRWMAYVWHGSSLSFLWHLPITSHQWTWLRAPWAMASSLPWVILMLSSPWPWLSWLMCCGVALASTMACHTRARAFLMGLLASVVLAGLMTVSSRWPNVGIALSLASTVLLLGVGPAYLALVGRVDPSRARKSRLGYGRHVITSLAWRDVRCLWQTQRLLIVLGGGISTVFVLFAWAVARHHGPSDVVVWSVLCVLAPGWMQAVAQLKGTLGDQFDSVMWPVTTAARLASLVMVLSVHGVLTILYAGCVALVCQARWPWVQWVVLMMVLLVLVVYAIWASLAQRHHVHAAQWLLFFAVAIGLLVLAPWFVAIPLLAVALWFGVLKAQGQLSKHREDEVCLRY